jgi:long-chain acyl-CoA synthetase
MEKINLAAKFIKNAELTPEKVFIKSKFNGTYKDFSWEEIKLYVFKIASFIISKNVSLKSKVALLSHNRLEWLCCDFAILCSGCATVPIYPTSTSGQIKYILQDADVKIIFVENKEQYEKVKDFDFLEEIVLLDDIHEDITTFNNIVKSQEVFYDKIKEIVKAIEMEDLVTLIYTSGTTGPPKGVYLTHNNFLHNIIRGGEVIDINENDIFLSHLPLSHVLERCVGHFVPMYYSAVIAYAEDINTIGDNLKEIKPTMFVSVPRVYEKILERVIEKVREASRFKQKMFYAAKDTALKYAEHKAYGKGFSFFDKLKYNFFEKKVYSKLRDVFGGRMKTMISGGAKLPYEVGLFYNGIGINLLEGYGLTETSPVISVNLTNKNKIGTVGKPLKDVEVKIAEDGEILVKGPNVTKGYHNKPEENKLAFKDGYFCTGDIGVLDNDGFLKITDRKKDLLVTSGGKNIAPQPIENILKEDPFITEVMVYGDGKKFLSALIVPHFEAIEQWAKERKLTFKSNKEMVENEKVKRLIMHRIERRSEPLAKFEKIKKFILLDKEFSMEQGEVTPTLKLKRKIITDKYKEQLEKLYED